MSKTLALLFAALMCALPGTTALLRAQGNRPDFTGVYYPINPFGNVVQGRAAAPPPAAGTRDGELPPPRPVLDRPRGQRNRPRWRMARRVALPMLPH